MCRTLRFDTLGMPGGGNYKSFIKIQKTKNIKNHEKKQEKRNLRKKKV